MTTENAPGRAAKGPAAGIHRVTPRPLGGAAAVALLMGALLWAPSGAQAQSLAGQQSGLDAMEGRFRLGIGLFLKAFETSVQVGLRDIDLGTDIDLEDDLGLDVDDTNIRLDGYYRFTSRSRLNFGYYRWRRLSRIVLEEEIVYDDTVFEVGLDVRSHFDGDVLKAAYTYSVVRTDRLGLALTAGLSVFDFGMGIAAVGYISGEPGDVSGEWKEEHDDLVAPVPVLGLRYGHLLGDSVMLRFSGEVFGLSVSNWEASLVDVKLALDWFPWQHVGLTVAYNWIDMSYDKHGNKEISVDYEYHGPVVYAVIRF